MSCDLCSLLRRAHQAAERLIRTFHCRQTDDGIKLFLGGLSWSLSEGDDSKRKTHPFPCYSTSHLCAYTAWL